MNEITPGLYRWTVAHPEWAPEKDKPGGWGQMVGAVLFQPKKENVVVLMDPIAPGDSEPEAAGFWKHLDKVVPKGKGQLVILLTNHFHSRTAQRVFDRYDQSCSCSLWAHVSVKEKEKVRLTHTFETRKKLPGGMEALPIDGYEASETAYWLPEPRALVVGDAMTGIGDNEVRVAPASWAESTSEGQTRYREKFRSSLRGLLKLNPEMLLVSHGEIVTKEGKQALSKALNAPAWGES